MGLDIWFKEDIKTALKAAYGSLDATMRATCGDVLSPTEAAYREGYVAALRTIAYNFGLDCTGSESQETHEDGRFAFPEEIKHAARSVGCSVPPWHIF